MAYTEAAKEDLQVFIRKNIQEYPLPSVTPIKKRKVMKCYIRLGYFFKKKNKPLRFMYSQL